jgi:RNA polymerase sigma factor (sigma-70 family)
LKVVEQHKHAHLVEGCRNGSSRDQVKIYELYYRAMYNTALRMLHDVVEAEDLMQEAFLDAFRKIDSYKGDAAFGSWLKRIVVNKCINVLNKRKAFFTEIDEERNVYSDEEPEQEDLTHQVAEVREGIRQLADGYRVILSLYLLEGFDHDEIAKVMGITASTSRSQYTRARAKLRNWLQNRN